MGDKQISESVTCLAVEEAPLRPTRCILWPFLGSTDDRSYRWGIGFEISLQYERHPAMDDSSEERREENVPV